MMLLQEIKFSQKLRMCVFLWLIFENNSNEYIYLFVNVVFFLQKVMIILMFNIDLILDNLMYRNDKIYLLLLINLMWIMEEFCVFYLYVQYILCIDFVQFIDYFISIILLDRKIKSLKNNFC